MNKKGYLIRSKNNVSFVEYYGFNKYKESYERFNIAEIENIDNNFYLKTEYSTEEITYDIDNRVYILANSINGERINGKELQKEQNNKTKKQENEGQKNEEELLIKKEKILDERKKRIIVKAIPKIRNLSKNQNNKNNIHSKYAFDNISQKIKVLFHKFLINLINDFIFKVYGGFQKFKIRKISSKITQNVTKKYNHFLSNCTLKAFFTNKISTKYRKISENKNFESIQKLIEFKPKLNELFNLKYSFVYKNYFLFGNREELKNKFGLSDSTFIFNDCLKKMKQKENDDYILKVNEVAKGKLLDMFNQSNFFFEENNFNDKLNNFNFFSNL